MTINEIKNAISALARRSDGRIVSIPKELRGAILSQAKIDGDESVGKAVGISATTIYGWSTKGKMFSKRGRFRRIEVVPERVEPTFIVEGPKGLRFVGLSLRDAARLIREVSHEL